MSETFTTSVQTANSDPGRRAPGNIARIIARMRRQPATVVAALYIVLLFATAFLAPFIAPHDPAASDFDNVLAGPSAQYLLGTDDMGRDVLSRVIFGAQMATIIAIGAVAISTVIGVPLGLIFGFNGGWWDRIGMRFIDMAQSLPGMLIGITVVTLLGRDPLALMLGIGLIFAGAFARMTRAVVLVESGKLYVEAAQVAGLRRGQIIFGQVLPNLIGPIATQFAVFLGSAIMIESAMSFLGVGLDDKIPTWGSILSLALEKQAVAPFLTWPPGIAIMLTVLAFSVFGDGLNDALTGERRRVPRLDMPGRQTEPSATTPPITSDVATAADVSAASSGAPVLDVRDTTVTFARPDGSTVDVVKSVSLTVGRGEVVGLLGESGSGKSTLARAVLGMLPAGAWLSNGSIVLNGQQLARRTERELRHVRGTQMGAVFQDPMQALSPVHTIGVQLTEPLRIHKGMNRAQARARAIELLDRVGVRNPASRLDDYPHQFSGGMAQRVAIAMALAADPELLIADEATSALDVTTQAQVLDLIMDLRDEYGMGVLMITHSLGVVAETCDRAVVMYRGRIVEDAAATQLFDAPQHLYTRALLEANPSNADADGRLAVIEGELRQEIDRLIDELDAEDAR
ncbi:dipeptide/oligopeptide/nickel ABC transporter permease/ATP-binding protein [Salinibacterium sp. ZJ77]|uniref:dipeptide/oligopeptide/nickel ABC transporter permease/ATP-binding protein n=1 Tax=Salinibacterium sp. ZJ77 TaxID=2708337 RepID=UPI00141DED22|nr:dipeptide/oligopeptide/nickel ABC transporter permease/ATP-binding protein [Salinibacterium sp. ZJ77]